MGQTWAALLLQPLTVRHGHSAALSDLRAQQPTTLLLCTQHSCSTMLFQAAGGAAGGLQGWESRQQQHMVKRGAVVDTRKGMACMESQSTSRPNQPLLMQVSIDDTRCWQPLNALLCAGLLCAGYSKRCIMRHQNSHHTDLQV